MSEKILITKDLHKTYRSGIKDVRAVNGITLEIIKGKSVAIVGPSGAGKSTLLHMLGGLDKPSSGKILIDDIDIYKLSDKDRATVRNKRIGFVFQFYHLLPEFTALENVMMPSLMTNAIHLPGRQAGNTPWPARIYSQDRRYTIRKRAIDVLRSVSLEHRMEHLPSRLSGGECQRVAIARALINEPNILLCDEPTGNLDSKTSDAIYELLFTVKSKSKTTLIIVSHDEKLTTKVDFNIRLKDGKLE